MDNKAAKILPNQYSNHMTINPLLKVKHLKTYFNTEEGLVKAVDDVSFTINRGQTVGIVGESGSGKSVTSLSLMRLVAQPPGEIVGGEALFYPTEGEEPVDLLSLPENEMRSYRGNRLSMIFQEPMSSLNPVFRCGDQVVEAVLLHQKVTPQQAREQTLALFEKVRLPDPQRIFDAYPHQISGGQKQRVMIAMALSCNPSLLIADEPTTALDVTVQKSILQLIKELQQDFQTSVMFITHDLGVIAEIADYVIVMYKGKIVESGTIEAIFNNPQHPYTKGLLACRPPLDFRMRQLPVIDDFMEEIEENGKAVIKEKQSDLKKVIDAFIVPQAETDLRLQGLMQKEPLLEVNNLKTWFPNQRNFFGKVKSYVKAVDDVSFKVYPGETLGLVGESGCGKTTLGRSLLRLTPVKEGQIFYQGKDLLQLSLKEMKSKRRDLQIIFQDPFSSLNPRMTIGQAILEPMQVHNILGSEKERKERVVELLETVNLNAKHYNRYPHEFSGGQRQRIGIARALALNPKFLICDESVSALDVSVQAQVLNLLMELRERLGLTYIFISHDLSVVKFISDRMMVMNDGKIEELGGADEVYSQPKSDYTRKLIDAIPKGR